MIGTGALGRTTNGSRRLPLVGVFANSLAAAAATVAEAAARASAPQSGVQATRGQRQPEIRQSAMLPDIAGYCRRLPDSAGYCRRLPEIACGAAGTGYCRILPAITGFCRILLDFARFCQILPEHCRILPDFAGRNVWQSSPTFGNILQQWVCRILPDITS